MRDRTRVLLIAFVILVADQVAKAVVSAPSFRCNSACPVIDGFYRAVPRRKPRGRVRVVLFSAGDGAVARSRSSIVSVLAVVLIWAYAREGWHEPRIVTAFGLILGGAVGNLVDRVRLGYVVDFIDVHWGSVPLAVVQRRRRRDHRRRG